MFEAKSSPPAETELHIDQPALSNAAKRKLAVFTNPSGYLLTDSLVSEFLRNERPVVWLRLGKEDRDPATLLLSLIAAAQRVHPEAGSYTMAYMHRHPGPATGWPRLFKLLADELSATLPTSSALVLEHVHNLLSEQPVLGLLNLHFLTALPPESVRILISHQRLPLADSSLPVAAFNQEDLRIDLDAGCNLAEKVDSDLPRAAIQRAISLVDGQIVPLACLLKASTILGPVYIQQILKQSRNMQQLLNAIVHATLSVATPQSLYALVLALHLDYYHPQLLQKVHSSESFITAPLVQPLGGQWRRIRCLWQTPLQSAMQNLTTSSSSLLEYTAGKLYASGADLQAIKLCLRIGDHVQAAEWLSSSVDQMMDNGQWETVRIWLDQLSPHVIQEHPGLIYVKGEMAVMRGETRKARIHFQHSASLFSARAEPVGACQSLLAESALAAAQDETGKARECAATASRIAEAAQLNWYAGWAKWELGCLAAADSDLTAALKYFQAAHQAIPHPPESDLFREVIDLLQQQLELQRQREFHHQAFLDARRATHATGARLNGLLNSPAGNLYDLLSAHGWSHTPLFLKMPALNVPGPETNPSQLANLWNGFLKLVGLSPNTPESNDLLIGSLPPVLFANLPALELFGEGKQSLASNSRPESPGVSKDLNISQAPETRPVQASTSEKKELDLELKVSSRTNAGHPSSAGVSFAYLEDPSSLGEGHPSFGEGHPSFGEGHPSPDLSIYCFGAFRVLQDQKLVETWTSRKALSIFKYLIMHRDEPVVKDILMDLFWPEADPEAARRNLHQAIYSLRQSLKTDTEDRTHIVFENNCYGINPDLELWVDFEEFERQAEKGQLYERDNQILNAIQAYSLALDLYQDNFLTEDLYDDWCASQRQRLWQVYLLVAQRLTKLYMTHDDYSAAIGISHRILELDPSQESAHQNLIRCYQQQGQRQLAIRQYQICTQVLEKELGVAPTQKTTSLYRQLAEV